MIKKEAAVIFLVFISFSFFSCKTGRSVAGTGNFDKLSDNLIMEKLAESNLQFTYLKYDCDVKFLTDGNDIEGNAEVRMKKDEYIWIAAKKFGFEIARVLIRPDSFFLLDRFNRNYTAESVDYLTKTYGLPFGFKELQDIMAGNNLVNDQQVKSRSFSDNNYLIETSGSKFNVSYVLNNSFYTTFARISDSLSKSVEIKYSDFKKIEKREIPNTRVYKYSGSSSENSVIEIRINELLIDKQHKIKFEIPSGYEKI
ncbi:MAG: DUF4292 domain-containing protein [Saprospiraceae bacterium]|nr:DUF4292 domain-containing protein [Saprospiraceae bacterium]